MKLAAFRLTMTAAVILAAVTTASAQNMKAEIPFPFQTGGAHMQPGSYQVSVSRSAGVPVLALYNVDQRRSVLTLSQASASPRTKADFKTILSFACAEDRCQLASVQDGSMVYTFHTAKASGTRIATVVLRPDRAE